jgi:hypothetical protein
LKNPKICDYIKFSYFEEPYYKISLSCFIIFHHDLIIRECYMFEQGFHWIHQDQSTAYNKALKLFDTYVDQKQKNDKL